ncbi:MAG: N-(5'-phosphoribosyl)anthranilate isomerase, partial [Gemmatimonadota bacterium]
MTVRVKICGITSREDAQLAVEAGADALGFIQVPGTPRYIAPNRVREIVATLPPFVTPVLVFADRPATEVESVAAECGAGVVQLHGDE